MRRRKRDRFFFLFLEEGGKGEVKKKKGGRGKKNHVNGVMLTDIFVLFSIERGGERRRNGVKGCRFLT